MTSEQEKTTREKFNYLKKYYDETWDKTNTTLHVGLFKNDNDSLEKAYKQATSYLIENASSFLALDGNSSVLDVGCGAGRTLIEICVEYGCCGTGVDLSDEQIKDARSYLREVNAERILNGLPRVRVKFIRGSGSELGTLLKKGEQFTHIISQDAILMVSNKQSLFENIHRLLIPGGVFAVADFLSELVTDKISESEKNLVYKFVNWNESLSFRAYEEILKAVGLNVVKSERRDKDMVKTYENLAQRMEKYKSKNDKTYNELGERYKAIVSSVKEGKMGWGLLFAQKPSRKTILLAGTKEKSIGRFLAKAFHSIGWEVWLYSRSVKNIDELNWHERPCDISSEQSIKKLIKEIPRLDLAIMLADTGGHDMLEETSERSVKAFVNSKLVGSVILTKALLLKFSNNTEPLKIIWLGGSTSKKPKDLILYAIVNSGLVAFVEELNEHYKNILKAYYLSTGPIMPSTLGDEYIEKRGPEMAHLAKNPSWVLEKVNEILEGQMGLTKGN
jgi:cyclopropane fatty-acyl-phospholipid synthase-like methyltransferase/NAD(P)-dependent dehydrogenase (short-subunit alcohol dehydrogenase family)